MVKKYKKTKINQHILHPQTQMMSYGYDPFMSEGAVKPPVFLTSTFVFKSAQDGADYFDYATGRKECPKGSDVGLIYSRFNHPNLEITEDRLALLEEAESCAVFSSGMASIGTIFLALLKPNDVIVYSSPIYGGTEVMLSKLMPQFNIKKEEFYDGFDEHKIFQTLENGAKKGNVAMVYIETPANPTNMMVDFAKINKCVDKFEKKYNIRPIIVCDNTLLGPIFQKPLKHGVDLVCYSLTKYVGGHSDLVAGAVMGSNELMAKVRSVRNGFGSQLDPHSSWMISRSLETLYIRFEKAQKNAEIIAQWLNSNKYSKVKLYHPKFIKNKEYQNVIKKQTDGYGSTFSFVINGSRKQAFKLIDSLTIFKSAVSLGGSESLVCHPASTTHSSVSEDIRKLSGVEEGLIRLSIGIENPQDLIADLDNAFSTVFK